MKAWLAARKDITIKIQGMLLINMQKSVVDGTEEEKALLWSFMPPPEAAPHLKTMS